MQFLMAWSIPIMWAIFGAYWLFAASRARATQRAETRGSRWTHLALIVSAFALIITGGLSIGPLARNILPQSNAVQVIGIIVTALGLLLAIWARVHLGRYWSGTIAIKQDHRLIRTGPYAWVRHPIYTGLLVGMAGTAIAVGEVSGLLATVLIFIAYYRKIRIEERFLVEQFGPEYVQYQHEVKALVPLVV